MKVVDTGLAASEAQLLLYQPTIIETSGAMEILVKIN